MLLWAKAALALAQAVGARFVGDRCFVGASALSYTTIVSLVPLTAIVLATFSGFPIFAAARSRFIDLVAENVAQGLGNDAVMWLSAFATNAAKTTGYGILGLVLTSVLLLATVEEHLHFIFRVTRARAWGQRVVAYWTVLTLGPLLVGVLLSLSGDIDHLVSQLGTEPNVAQQAAQASVAWLERVLPVGLQVLGFAALYWVIPNRPLSWRHCLAGGVLAGLLLEAMKLGFGVFYGHIASYSAIYGALAAVPIALLWMYIFWGVALLGAEMVAVLNERAPADQPLAPGCMT